MDLVEELRQAANLLQSAVPAALSDGEFPPVGNSELLNRAAAEIERLRSLVGAVSAGPSFRDLKDAPKHSDG